MDSQQPFGNGIDIQVVLRRSTQKKEHLPPTYMNSATVQPNTFLANEKHLNTVNTLRNSKENHRANSSVECDFSSLIDGSQSNPNASIKLIGVKLDDPMVVVSSKPPEMPKDFTFDS